MRVYVASLNPVKLNATRDAFNAVFPGTPIDIKGIQSESGVAEQPATDRETYTGALNRARYIKEQYPGADYWVGIEGGIDYHEQMAEAFAWIVIRDGNQNGKARSCSFQLPLKVDQLLKDGYELGIANDMVFSTKNSKHKGGAVGSLTMGAVTRTDLYVQPIKLALIPMLNPDLFREQPEKKKA